MSNSKDPDGMGFWSWR